MQLFIESITSPLGLLSSLFLIVSIISFFLLKDKVKVFTTLLLLAIGIMLGFISLTLNQPDVKFGKEVLIGLQTDIPETDLELVDRLMIRAIDEIKNDDFRSARATYARARSIYRNLGNIIGEGQVALGLGDLERSAGQIQTSRANYSEAVGQFRQGGSSIWLSRALVSLGDLENSESNEADARELYAEAIIEWNKSPHSNDSIERIKSKKNSEFILDLYNRITDIQLLFNN